VLPRFAYKSERSADGNFIHQQNLALFNKRLAERHTDEEREVIMKLLTGEQAKEPPPTNGIVKPRLLLQQATAAKRPTSNKRGGKDFPVPPPGRQF
jgi:hypothetical protein